MAKKIKNMREKLIKEMLKEKANKNNSIDLNAYAIGLSDMYDKLHKAELGNNEVGQRLDTAEKRNIFNEGYTLGLRSGIKKNEVNTNLDLGYWVLRNNGGEEFIFYIDKENRACFRVKYEDCLMSSLAMTKSEFAKLIETLIEMNKKVLR